jgi:hypothetical protein
MTQKIPRGSRKQVLDWTSRPDFPSDLVRLVRPVDAAVTATSMWMPRGYTSSAEARLETFGPRAIPKGLVRTEEVVVTT